MSSCDVACDCLPPPPPLLLLLLRRRLVGCSAFDVGASRDWQPDGDAHPYSGNRLIQIAHPPSKLSTR